jgi:NAD(P)-dependent dehydrogenase (short-subunit alcohol dehydrogenase family)
MFLVSLNITKQEDIEAAARIINKHTESTGEVFYSLVNNAGISGFSPLEWGSFKEDVQPVIDVNLKATVKVTESMIPLLRKNHDSRIINMTSYVTHIAMPFISTYCVSKCGLRAFSEVLRRDMESNTEYFNGMKVITIEPTAYKTGIVGYDNIKSTLRRTWNRSDPEVKDSYGVSIFDGMVAFVAVCEFFRFFDFVALKRNVHEVSEYVREALLHTHPNVDVKILTKSIEVGSNIWFHFIPQDIQELYFMLLAWTGYIFVVEVAFIKKFLRTNVN